MRVMRKLQTLYFSFGNGNSKVTEGLTSLPLNTKVMEHLTNFELILVGASIATFCFGFNAFMKNIFLRNFNTHKS